MDLSFMSEYIVVVVVAFCIGLGHVIKHSLDFIPKKYIPLIMGVTGMLFNIFLNDWNITPIVLVSGLISGLSSTGIYETYKNVVKIHYAEEETKEPTENE